MFTLHNGENLSFLRSLESDMIDLIYIDPPYFSQRNYGDFDDRWQSMQHYLDFMVERLREMYRLLKPTGSIYVHLDWHAVHYVKIEMDKIFGYDNFVNEIIWHHDMGGRGKTRFARKHDTILFYSKSEKYIFNPVLIPYKSKMTEWVHLHGTQKGKPIPVGRIPSDVWEMTFNTMSKERNGYATQKPSEIMKRIILASSNEGDIVADFFCGSGSFLKVAHELGRSCIGCDSNQTAVLRLKPFTPSNNRLHLDVGDSPAQQALFTPEADTAEGKLPTPARR